MRKWFSSSVSGSFSRKVFEIGTIGQVLGAHERRPGLVGRFKILPNKFETSLGIRVIIIENQCHEVPPRAVPPRNVNRFANGPMNTVRRITCQVIA